MDTITCQHVAKNNAVSSKSAFRKNQVDQIDNVLEIVSPGLTNLYLP